MTENLKGKMGHNMNHFNVGKGHPIEEVKIILHCINLNIPCHKALNACTLSTTFNFVKKYTFFHLVLCPHLPPTKSEPLSDHPPPPAPSLPEKRSSPILLRNRTQSISQNRLKIGPELL